MSFSIRKKLLSTFALLWVSLTGVSINSWWQLNNTILIQQRIMDLRQPSVFSGQILITGINRSLAGLRAFIILEPEQAVVAISQISNTVHEVAYTTVEASESAQQASAISLQGSVAVEETVTSIKSLAGTIDITKTTINKLDAEAEGVNGIVSVISSITDQTNAVADEVRTLAARTQETTEEIQTVLERLRTGTIDAVQMMANIDLDAETTLKKSRVTSLAVGRTNDLTSNMGQMISQFQVL